nr:PREDICTED: uncharacterized protein LOC103994168 isoform X2 [Musa acuminata subsp. malaccensis]
MGLSKTEIDLIRLLEAASRQQNQTKLVHNRKLQEDLTDDMVGLARQLKESSLLMVQSLQDTEKIHDSIECCRALLGEHRPCHGGVFRKFEDHLFGMACDLRDDLCLHHNVMVLLSRVT